MTSPNSTFSTEKISLSNNPFIWGNIALITGVPWLLALSMAGLAVGDPVFPAWFEILLLGFPAIALTTWIQWQQPIFPFSLWFVAKPTESLSDRDRQILTLIKQHRNGWYTTGWIAAAVAILMSVIFCKIYLSAPLAEAIAPFPAGLRLFGILWAEIFFLLSNVLLQAGISALRIKLTAESELIGLQPFAVEKIKNSFTTIGWRSPQLLKIFEEELETNNLVEGSETVEAKTPILEPEQIVEEIQIETILESVVVQDQELDAQELDVQELDAITELEEFAIDELVSNEIEASLELADISSDEQFAESVEEIEEVEELEINAIAIEDCLIETSLEFTETISDEEIIQEYEEFNSFEIIEETELKVVLDIDSSIADSEIIETEVEVVLELEIEQILVATTSQTTETEENIVEEAEELESSESEPSEFVSEKPVVNANTPQVANKKTTDFLRKRHKTGSSHKKNGFGKSIKSDHNNAAVFTPDIIESDIDQEPAQPAIAAASIEQKLEVPENEPQDFDDELDELIAFNIYTENILQDYLKDDDENSIEVETQVLKDSTEDIVSNNQDADDQATQSTDDQAAKNSKQDHKYLVQEFLVDKFLARLEELNIADKANKANAEQTTENISEPNSEVDEFADLEALLDGNSLTENLE